MDDDAASGSQSYTRPKTYNGRTNTLECDAATIRGFRKYLGAKKYVAVSHNHEIVRVSESTPDRPKSSRLGAILNVELNPTNQGGILAQRIDLRKKIFLKRTDLPHATYPTVCWIMKDPTEHQMGWVEIMAPPDNVAPRLEIIDDDNDDDEYDEVSVPYASDSLLMWITGAGISIASGAAAIVTMENKKGFLGAVLGLLVFAGWSHFPAGGTDSRAAWIKSMNATAQTAENVVYAVQILPRIIYWLFWVVCILAAIWILVKIRNAYRYVAMPVLDVEKSKPTHKEIGDQEKKKAVCPESGPVSTSASGSQSPSRSVSEIGGEHPEKRRWTCDARYLFMGSRNPVPLSKTPCAGEIAETAHFLAGDYLTGGGGGIQLNTAGCAIPLCDDHAKTYRKTVAHRKCSEEN